MSPAHHAARMQRAGTAAESVAGALSCLACHSFMASAGVGEFASRFARKQKGPGEPMLTLEQATTCDINFDPQGVA